MLAVCSQVVDHLQLCYVDMRVHFRFWSGPVCKGEFKVLEEECPLGLSG